MTDAFFFGYGSLVNRATHHYPEAGKARLTGWRTVWRHIGDRRVAYLAAEPHEGSYIDGLIARVPGGDWAALDEREAAYLREPVTEQMTHSVERSIDVQTYWIPRELALVPEEPAIHLMSYLDVVVRGYLHEYGKDGVATFFQYTADWMPAIIDDRAAPLYPRAQRLDPEETALVDDWVRRLGLRVSLA